MKDNKYTPGPWFAVEYAGYFNIQSQDGYGEKYNLLDREEDENAEANAKLIAASPDLLEALQDVMAQMSGRYEDKSCGHHFTCICGTDKAIQAINKATV
jgi:hypothetical protein